MASVRFLFHSFRARALSSWLLSWRGRQDILTEIHDSCQDLNYRFSQGASLWFSLSTSPSCFLSNDLFCHVTSHYNSLPYSFLLRNSFFSRDSFLSSYCSLASHGFLAHASCLSRHGLLLPFGFPSCGGFLSRRVCGLEAYMTVSAVNVAEVLSEVAPGEDQGNGEDEEEERGGGKGAGEQVEEEIGKDKKERVKESLRSLNCSEERLDRLLSTRKKVLSRGCESILRKAALFQKFGINSQDFLTAVERDVMERNLLFASDENHESVLKFFQETLKVKDVGKFVRNLPQLLDCSLHSLEEKLALWSSLDVPLTGSIVEKYPLVLLFDLHTIKGGVNAVKSMFPQEIAIDILQNLPILVKRRKRDIFATVRGLHKLVDVEKTQHIIMKNPGLLLVAVNTMENTFAELGCLFGKAKALDMVMAQTTLITVSWGKINEKVDFLVREMSLSLEEIAACPKILTLSLNFRLKPRLHALCRVGRRGTSQSLAEIFFASNSDFEKRFEVKLPIQKTHDLRE